jgi:hypothetical protein
LGLKRGFVPAEPKVAFFSILNIIHHLSLTIGGFLKGRDEKDLVGRIADLG